MAQRRYTKLQSSTHISDYKRIDKKILSPFDMKRHFNKDYVEAIIKPNKGDRDFLSTQKPLINIARGLRAKLIRHCKDVLDVNLYKIKMDLKLQKNNSKPGEERITAELQQVLTVPQNLFNGVIPKGVTPDAWGRGVAVLLFKKNDTGR
ncbi:hypothetical protein EVAR_102727_1 [Eumeta japonica]|uniref:Uncharacterized protein n=1 Tax=Eumeta variegata TaxID=151549 RepID=A0A4C1TIY6_EUMVA|nr:hypothetical protein EVAR_102727_1 [Eumeta japonica]